MITIHSLAYSWGLFNPKASCYEVTQAVEAYGDVYSAGDKRSETDKLFFKKWLEILLGKTCNMRIFSRNEW